MGDNRNFRSLVRNLSWSVQISVGPQTCVAVRRLLKAALLLQKRKQSMKDTEMKGKGREKVGEEDEN